MLLVPTSDLISDQRVDIACSEIGMDTARSFGASQFEDITLLDQEKVHRLQADTFVQKLLPGLCTFLLGQTATLSSIPSHVFCPSQRKERNSLQWAGCNISQL
jgi:hypothetical protein